MTRVRTAVRSGIASVVLGAGVVGAQQRPPIGKEFRLDQIVARQATTQAGGSLIIPAGIYSRTSFTVAVGGAAQWGGTVARAEVISRFLLDPFREERYGLSVGGGVGITNAPDGKAGRPYLAAVIDLEMPRALGLIPAVQLGLGGGARLGLALRSGSDRWR